MAGTGRNRQGARPNDATGRKRDELAKQQAEAQKEREGQLTTITAQQEVVQQEGVHDPKTGALVNEDEVREAQARREAELAQRTGTGDVNQAWIAAQAATLAPGTRQPAHPDAEVDENGAMYVKGQEESPVQTNDTQIIGRGPETPFEVVGGTPADELMRRTVDTSNAPVRQAMDLGVQEVGRSEQTAVIRVNEDLPDMTFGVGNHYSFEVGKQYRVPKDVADHLEEKGYVWH